MFRSAPGANHAGLPAGRLFQGSFFLAAELFRQAVFQLGVDQVLKRDLQDLAALLRSNLVRTLESEAFSDISIEYALSRLSYIVIAKTDSRSVIGTINDNIWHTEVHAYHAGGVECAGLDDLSAHLNHMPMGPLNYDRAIRAFSKKTIRVA